VLAAGPTDPGIGLQISASRAVGGLGGHRPHGQRHNSLAGAQVCESVRDLDHSPVQVCPIQIILRVRRVAVDASAVVRRRPRGRES
jgi:hypothetical protein